MTDSLDTLLTLHSRALHHERTMPRRALYKGPLFNHLRPNVSERDAIRLNLYISGHITTPGDLNVHQAGHQPTAR